MKRSYITTIIEDVPLEVEFFYHADSCDPVEFDTIAISTSRVYKTPLVIGHLLSEQTLNKIRGQIILNSKSIKRNDYR